LPSAADRSRIPTSSNADYDGAADHELASRLGLPRVVVRDRVSSTLDVAHALASEGAAAGTLIIADAQASGRGRQGRVWQSEPGAGVWLTMLERPSDAGALDVLSLRIGIEVAPALDAFAETAVRLKWPNDLYVGARKLAGVLIEARWREQTPDWVAIGVGINVRAPSGDARAVGLRAGSTRLAVLAAVVPAIRRAAARSGMLAPAEIDRFAARDLAAGRWCIEPVAGRVRGIDRSGALLVDVGSLLTPVRAGSLVLTEEQ
jgi:BirA family transcriptional regulator, biotin operon repressor / biotin---[acetyl-CoA-carboxylase] ligase